MKMLRTPRPGTQRGAAALIVVMLLFFIVSLVAAYAGRNLIFEQKTSANQYRATQAFEAAEAGLEWALAMLNGGRIDDTCTPPSVGSTLISFRQRYLTIDADGRYSPALWAAGGPRERPSCVQSDTGWNCSCPAGEGPSPTIPPGGAVRPAFRVCFEAIAPPQPGVVRVVSTGSTSFDNVDRACDERGAGTAGDAAATVSVVVALSSPALTTPPSAALTVVGDLRNFAGPTGLTLVNTDPRTNGLTDSIGGDSPNPTNLTRVTVPGSPSEAPISPDPSLTGLQPEQMFTSLFRMRPDTYKHQPAAVMLKNCAASCSARLQEVVELNPGRIVWVEGDMDLFSAVDAGSETSPAQIVVNGNVRVFAPTRIEGMLYVHGNIQVFGPTTVEGAAVATGDISIFAPTVFEYGPEVLGQLVNRNTGSLVRVPGSWRDFP
jgi:PilX N-terminal